MIRFYNVWLKKIKHKKKVIESCFPLLVKDMKEGEVRNILNSSTLNGSQVKGNLFEHGTRAEALIVTDTCILLGD